MENLSRKLILITNDDSVDAPGIHHLAECVRSLGDVYVVAPAHPHSGQSAAITVSSPLRINELPPRTEGVRLFTVNGTPVDCVKLALAAILPRRPDIIFAGINHGSNAGVNVTYSGTMGAVLEGCLEGIPSVGFSLLHHSMKADFTLSTAFVAAIAAEIIEKGLPQGVCLNVNIPARVLPEGIKVCRAARGRWTDNYQRYLDPQGIPFYMLSGRFINDEPDADDTDEYWLSRRYVTVVPVAADQTAVAAIKSLAGRFSECADS
ncbi:MAG: 5'/3'-nucleotidase SurE [Muribaculaceae bacterium]|nr:5'/3'-nucleotidase SurE [Muribaculaceae bacterium]